MVVGGMSQSTRKRNYSGEQLEMTLANDVAREWYGAADDLDLYELRWCRSRIRPGSTVVDCGAHHGLMAMLFARWTGPAGRVIAYEPIPANVETLKANLQLNSISNVLVRPVALGAAGGRQKINVNGGNGVVGEGHLEIPVVRLDDDLDPGVAVHLLKVDVEGSDLDMLRGASRAIAQRPLVALELHNFLFHDRGATLDAIFTLLDARHWRYEVLPMIGDSAPAMVDGPMNIAWLSQFDNPHVFCSPRRAETLLAG